LFIYDKKTIKYDSHYYFIYDALPRPGVPNEYICLVWWPMKKQFDIKLVNIKKEIKIINDSRSYNLQQLFGTLFQEAHMQDFDYLINHIKAFYS